jgi:hypothetical protein
MAACGLFIWKMFTRKTRWDSRMKSMEILSEGFHAVDSVLVVVQNPTP